MYIFSVNDPYGVQSNLTLNVENHLNNKMKKQDFLYGTDKQLKKLFPRGKVFDKLLSNQLEQWSKQC